MYTQVAQARNMSISFYGKPLYRKKPVYIKTHKTAINLPVDPTGET